MALSFIFRIPSLMFTAVRKEQEKRKLSHRVRKANLMIKDMPEWQRKDLNINPEDLSKYKHFM